MNQTDWISIKFCKGMMHQYQVKKKFARLTFLGLVIFLTYDDPSYSLKNTFCSQTHLLLTVAQILIRLHKKCLCHAFISFIDVLIVSSFPCY